MADTISNPFRKGHAIQATMKKEKNILEKYEGKKVLIIGGLGFIGSNLAHRLVSLGASVTILDNLAPLYGGNIFNIEDIKDRVSTVIGDIRNEEIVNELVVGQDFIFNFAAQVSHIDSAGIPFEDLDINAKGQLVLLESCRNLNKNAKIIFPSSRLALGKITQNPVTEDHPANPLNLYGVHKLTAEKYCFLYSKNYGVKTVVLRITNPYGERQQIKHSKYSIPGWFMRLAMEGGVIKIFGNGNQKRDYLHISDLIEALLYSGIIDATDGQLYNCGFGKSVEFRRMAELVVKAVGSGSIEYVPWPINYEKEETGDFETDITKLFNATGWKPKVELEDGITRMCEYYKENKGEYVPSDSPTA